MSKSLADYQQALQQYQLSCESKASAETPPATADCPHSNVLHDKGVDVCTDCGEEIDYCMDYNRDWKYYGPSDTRHISNPNRVQLRKLEERSIYRDVENLGFSDSIVAEGNKIYAQVTKGRIFRGNSRRAIIFACIFHAYKIKNQPQSHERLIKIFNLSRKTGLRGLKHVNLYAPKESNIRTTYITPLNLINEIIEDFKPTPEQKNEIAQLYEKIKNKSSRLNRSRPQSVASALVYYWACNKGKTISLKDFASRVGLSELTINRNVREIAEILENE